MSTSVIKLGGNVLKRDEVLQPLLDALHQFTEDGHRVIIVHGGGSQADQLHDELDVPIEKVNGRRITDAESLEISKMVYRGTLNVNLVSDCLAHGMQAAGITGVDGNTVMVEKRPPVQINRGENAGPEGATEPVDFGFVGDIVTVNPELIDALLEQNIVPVVGCLAVDDEGQVYNVNADTLAAAIASNLSVDRLIYVTSVPGILEHEDAEESLSRVTLNDARSMIEDGTITEGMIPKMDSAEMALEGGVDEVLISGSLESKPAWNEEILNNTHGTTITSE